MGLANVLPLLKLKKIFVCRQVPIDSTSFLVIAKLSWALDYFYNYVLNCHVVNGLPITARRFN